MCDQLSGKFSLLFASGQCAHENLEASMQLWILVIKDLWEQKVNGMWNEKLICVY